MDEWSVIDYERHRQTTHTSHEILRLPTKAGWTETEKDPPGPDKSDKKGQLNMQLYHVRKERKKSQHGLARFFLNYI
jgi:hypothetical protein